MPRHDTARAAPRRAASRWLGARAKACGIVAAARCGVVASAATRYERVCLTFRPVTLVDLGEGGFTGLTAGLRTLFEF